MKISREFVQRKKGNLSKPVNGGEGAGRRKRRGRGGRRKQR